MSDHYRGLAPYYDIFVDWGKRLCGEMPFLLDECGVDRKTGCSVMDIGCGPGHHLAAFARAGCRVEGLEPSPHLRKLARENAPDALIHRSGMGSLGRLARRRGPWNFLICLGNTLVHLPPARLDSFLVDLATAAGPEGKVILHLLNYEKILRLKPVGLPDKLVIRDGAAWRFVRAYCYRENSLDFKLEVYRDGLKVAEDFEKLYPITAVRLKDSAAAAGFRDIRCYGAFDRNSPFTKDSDNLVVLLSVSVGG